MCHILFFVVVVIQNKFVFFVDQVKTHVWQVSVMQYKKNTQTHQKNALNIWLMEMEIKAPVAFVIGIFRLQ